MHHQNNKHLGYIEEKSQNYNITQNQLHNYKGIFIDL